MSSKNPAGTINKENLYLKEFGKSLKNLRVNYAQKSLRIFAYETDVPCATLSRIENGLRIPNIIILKRIAAGFDWTVEELITNIEKNISDEFKTFDVL